MKKALTIIFITASILIILDSFDFGHSLAMFLFIGLIPGTNVSLSPGDMLTLLGTLLGFTLGRLMRPATLRMAQRFQPKAAALVG